MNNVIDLKSNKVVLKIRKQEIITMIIDDPNIELVIH